LAICISVFSDFPPFSPGAESALTMSAIAKALGLPVSRVSRLIARAKWAKGKTP
jgi:hypothetical protein